MYSDRSHLRSSKALPERPQEGVGAFGIARWRLRKLLVDGVFPTNSADEFWENQSPTTCHGWFCRQIIGTEAWWGESHRPQDSQDAKKALDQSLYPSTIIHPNCQCWNMLKHVETCWNMLKHVETSISLRCASLCPSLCELCLAFWSCRTAPLWNLPGRGISWPVTFQPGSVVEFLCCHP